MQLIYMMWVDTLLEILFSFILLDTLEDNIHTHDMTKYGFREKRMNKDTLNRQAFPPFTHSGVE